MRIKKRLNKIFELILKIISLPGELSFDNGYKIALLLSPAESCPTDYQMD